MQLPRLYPILDPACFPDAEGVFAAAEEVAAAGCTLLQYRNKSGNARQVLDQARELRARLDINRKLIMNDRADLCLAEGFDGLHVGQGDVSPTGAGRTIGPAGWLGVSTHNREHLAEADKTSADYIAIGPVFAKTSKANPDPVVGLEGIRRARELTRKPLVAIGGITRANARFVVEAGADAVAGISDFFLGPGKSAEEIFAVFGESVGSPGAGILPGVTPATPCPGGSR